MIDATTDLGARLARVEGMLAEMDTRLRALERRGESPSLAESPGSAATPGTPPMAPATAAADVGAILPLVGRTFMAFGGAFLLRALTDSGRLPRGAGIALGLAFALACLALASRAATRGRAWSGVLHGFTALGVGLPLLWEATTRFGFMTPGWSALALAILGGLALLVAWHARLHALAALATIGVMTTSVVLVGGTGQLIPFSLILLGLGVATLWLSYDRDWFWLRWPTAFAADIALIGLATRAVHPARLDPPLVVILVQLLLLASYLTSFGVRSLLRGRRVIVFEAVQTVAALAVGLGGAVAVARATGTGEGALGAVAALLGASGYAAAFAVVGRRQGVGRNFYFYATLGMLLVVTACAVLLHGLPLTLALTALAVATTGLGFAWSRHALAVHGAVYGTAAAVMSGLVPAAMAALGADATTPWAPITAACWVALAGLAVCLAIPRPGQEADAPQLAGVPRATFAVLVFLGAGGALVWLVAPALAGGPPDPGVLATVRTTVISLGALSIALCSQHARFADLGWLPYVVLTAGALKLLAEDFPRSRPSTLFVALAVFGAALLVTPRLLHRGKPTPAPVTEAQG